MLGRAVWRRFSSHECACQRVLKGSLEGLSDLALPCAFGCRLRRFECGFVLFINRNHVFMSQHFSPIAEHALEFGEYG